MLFICDSICVYMCIYMCVQIHVPLSMHMEDKRGHMVCLICLIGISRHLELSVFQQSWQT